MEDLLLKLKKYDFPASVVVLEAWSDEATFHIWSGAKYTPAPNRQAQKYEDYHFESRRGNSSFCEGVAAAAYSIASG